MHLWLNLLGVFYPMPLGVGLHHPIPLEKDLTSNPEVLETLGFFPQHL